ncbi:GGDEF domain-containing protein [Actinoplanes sp. TRM 88003]|uniref:GGDEF domain-containing protein n=1 Tax=Paractinoplanes aksuensis TaxID=2939490 RepID=A0ABT1E6Z8_9ACTN|nr:GGDEF domain-containing protein [Actinoplanes aksuensis]MCO8278031.1 GGDEF domain-containing protein [Actinoplanes aksuensis]
MGLVRLLVTASVAAGTALGPRNLRTARRWVAIIIGSATAVFVGSALLSESSLMGVHLICAAVLALFCSILMVLPENRTAPLCVVGPLLGTAGIVTLDLGTADASLTGQIFFCIPVLYASVHLRVPGAVLITAAAVIGDTVVVYTLLPAGQALTELAFMACLLILMAAVLTRATVTQHRLIAQLQHQAAVDPLTGMATRRVLDDRARAAITATTHEPRNGPGLIWLDVDNFKTINDTHGHVTGDEALIHITTVLRRHCTPHDTLTRMGGDEIAILLPRCDLHSLIRQAQHIVDAVRHDPLHLADGRELSLSVSAGTAHLSQHGHDLRDLYAAADAALYDAKRNGRGRLGRTPAADPTPPRADNVATRVAADQRASRSAATPRLFLPYGE